MEAAVVPIIMEATKFFFSEASKWLAKRREMADKKPVTTQEEMADKKPVTTQEEIVHYDQPPLKREDFLEIEKSPQSVLNLVDENMAKTNAYVVKGLVDQIKIHLKNLSDLEKAEAEYGTLVPQHVKRGIEREKNALDEKTIRLKSLLEKIYGRKIEN